MRPHKAFAPSLAVRPNWWRAHLQPVRSSEQVAAMLGISVSAVHSYESTAIRKLREAFTQLKTERRLT